VSKEKGSHPGTGHPVDKVQLIGVKPGSLMKGQRLHGTHGFNSAHAMPIQPLQSQHVVLIDFINDAA
jgi:hypothetical protein